MKSGFPDDRFSRSLPHLSSYLGFPRLGREGDVRLDLPRWFVWTAIGSIVVILASIGVVSTCVWLERWK